MLAVGASQGNIVNMCAHGRGDRRNSLALIHEAEQHRVWFKRKQDKQAV